MATTSYYDAVGGGDTRYGFSPPVITADSLSKPQKQVQLPPPPQITQPQQFVQNLQPAIQQSQQGLIEANTREAKQRDDVLGRLLNVDDPNSQSIYDNRFNQLGGDNYLKQFTDANTRLAQLQGVFNTGSQKVSSAPGQSQVFEGLQLNEVSRQKAVEVGNQALVVQAMQGNIETARGIAAQTAEFALEDRQAKLQSLMSQFGALDGIVQGQEQQLIDIRKEEVASELRELDFTRNITLEAINSGVASVEEMQKLASAGVSYEDKQAIAQSILGRAATENRGLKLDEIAFNREFALAELGLKERQLLDSTPGAELNPTTGEVEVQLSEDQLRKVDATNEKKNLDSLANLERSATRYEELVKQYGFELSGTGRTLLEGAYADLKVKWKEAANLGALTGPDLDLIIDAVKPATGLGGLKQKLIGGGTGGLLTQLDKLKGNIVEDGQRYYNNLIQRNENYQYSPYIQSLGKPFGITTPGQQSKADSLFNGFTGGSEGTNPKAPLTPSSQLTSVLTNKFPPGSTGGQCGDFARKLATTLGTTYPRLGNSLTEKIKAVRTHGGSIAQAKLGSVIVTKENPTFGHVATIVGKNAKGFVVAESNFKQSNKVSYGRTIPFNSPEIVGVINPTKA